MNLEFILEKLKTYPLAICCSIIGVACLVVLYARSGIVDELSIKEADLASEIQAIKENIKNSKSLAQHVEEMEALAEEIDARLFRKDERAVNLNFFYEFEEDQNVSYGSLNQRGAGSAIYRKGGARPLKEYSTMVFSISLQDSFEKILRIMHALETSRPLIRVGSFDLKGTGNFSSMDQAEATMRVIILAAND